MAFAWNDRDGFFAPADRFKSKAHEMFADRAIYWLTPEPQRSEKTHGHEFAVIKDAWLNLPESLAEQYPSPDSLRKRALIQAGYYDEQIIDAGTNAAALRVAQGVKSFPGEDFSMVFVRGVFVIIRRAKSQSYRAMGARDFQASKSAVLDIIAQMIGVTTAELSAHSQGGGSSNVPAEAC